MSQEIYSYIIPKLFEAKALDVFCTSIYMKKNRPAVKLTVICNKQDIKNIEEIIFLETTTFGIRKYPVKRKKLERRFEKVDTKFGTVSVKIGILNGKIIKRIPEYSDCEKLAIKNKVTIQSIFNEVLINIK